MNKKNFSLLILLLLPIIGLMAYFSSSPKPSLPSPPAATPLSKNKKEKPRKPSQTFQQNTPVITKPAPGGKYFQSIHGQIYQHDLKSQSDLKRSLIEASQRFFEDHKGLYFSNIDTERLKLADVRTGKVKKVVYTQRINEVPVLNSRVALFFNEQGLLYLAQSNVIPQTSPVETDPLISLAEAAKVAFQALKKNYQKENLSIPPEYNASILERMGIFALFLGESGRVSRVYRFLIPIQEGPLAGEHDIIVDTNGPIVIRNRKSSRDH